jgi:hypothetical protein
MCCVDGECDIYVGGNHVARIGAVLKKSGSSVGVGHRVQGFGFRV